MHALQFYFHTTVSADLFFLPFSQKDFIGLSPLANHDFGFFAQHVHRLDCMHALPFISSFPSSHFPFPVPTFRMTRNLPLVSGRPSPCARASQREIPPSERVGGWGQDKHCLDKTISYAQNILWTILVEICGCEATIPCEIQSMLHLQHCWQPVQTSIHTDSFCANCSDKCDLSYSSLESRMSV